MTNVITKPNIPHPLIMVRGKGASPAGEPADASGRGLTHSPQCILVVEDNLDIGQIYAQLLVCAGYEVAIAEDGAAGWEALHAGRFDLLITDNEMPKLSGLELVKKVRCARLTLPVILASGRLHAEELKRHPWLQVAALLLKPVCAHELLATVREALAAPNPARSGPEACNTNWIPGFSATNAMARTSEAFNANTLIGADVPVQVQNPQMKLHANK